MYNSFTFYKLTVLGYLLRGIGYFFYVLGSGLLIAVAVIAVPGGIKGFIAIKSEPILEIFKIIGLVILGAIIVIIAGFLIQISGKHILILGKKLLAKANSLKFKTRIGVLKPVLYLRSFADDKKMATTSGVEMNIKGIWVELPGLSTEEEHLATAFSGIGPFIAIAKPKENLPKLGALRINADETNWHEKVTSLMLEAELVVFRISNGFWLWWEIETALKIVKPERLVFLIPTNNKLYSEFKKKLEYATSLSLPVSVVSSNENISIGSILYFNSDYSSQTIALKNAGYRASEGKPLLPMLKIALKPLYERLNKQWNPPPIPVKLVSTFFYSLFVALFLLFVCFVIIFYNLFSFNNITGIVLSGIIFLLTILGVIKLIVNGSVLNSAIKQFKFDHNVSLWKERNSKEV